MGEKNLSGSTKGAILGFLFGLILLIFVFLYFWFLGASSYVQTEMIPDYNNYNSCRNCVGQGKTPFECAIINCNAKSGIDCKEEFDREIDSILEVNSLVDENEIAGVEKEKTLFLTSTYCGYLEPSYTPEGLTLTEQAVYKTKPSLFQVLFNKDAVQVGKDKFSELNTRFFLLYILLLVPVLGLLIGFFIGRRD
ncbi:MAG: hypothetical protein ABIH28_02920 [archaeon]